MVKTQLAAVAAACAVGLASAHTPAFSLRRDLQFPSVEPAPPAEQPDDPFDAAAPEMPEPELEDPFPVAADMPASAPAVMQPWVGAGAEPWFKDTPVNEGPNFPDIDAVCKYDFAKYCAMYVEPPPPPPFEPPAPIGNFYTATTEIFLAAARRLQVLPAEPAPAETESAPAEPRKHRFGRFRDRFHRIFRGDHGEAAAESDAAAGAAAGNAANVAPAQPADTPRVNGRRPLNMREKHGRHSIAHWHQHENHHERHHFHHHERHNEGHHEGHHKAHHFHHHGFHRTVPGSDVREHGRTNVRRVAAAMFHPLTVAVPAPYPIPNPLGNNPAGEMCMRAHFQHLSPECRERVEAYDQMVKDYEPTTPDEYEDLDEDEHHHSLIGVWFYAAFWVALSVWVCKRSKARLVKHEQVRAVLDTVRETAQLKTAVESRIGVEVPQLRKVNTCCFYFLPGLIVFWAVMATLGAIFSTGHYFAEENPEAGETLGWVLIGVIGTLIVVFGVAFARRAGFSSDRLPWRGYAYSGNPGYIALTGVSSPSAPDDRSPEVYTGVPVQPPPGVAAAARGYNPPNVL